MLQQTQVPRVVPRYGAFLDRWPDPPACAAAPLSEVISAWAGLGYYRRAVNLHRCAVALTERHGGNVPDRLDELLALPGIGAYTARAVLAFAWEQPCGVLDTNAARVLARAVAGRRLGPAEAQRMADAVVPPGRSWAWNQAVLDLGATVCRARRPDCDACPLAPQARCAWHRAGRPDPDPAEGSAGTSRPQGRWRGSDREGRGKLVASLIAGPLPAGRLAEAAGWPDDPRRARRVAGELVADGVAVATAGGGLRLA
jgi:A/G-specific adenine glycosylase